MLSLTCRRFAPLLSALSMLLGLIFLNRREAIEERHGTRPMGCIRNLASMDRIIFGLTSHLNTH